MSKDYQYKKKYRESPKGKKAHKIASWKYQGIISSDWDLLYEKFINTTHCGLCNIELIEGKKTNSRCLKMVIMLGIYYVISVITIMIENQGTS